MKEYQNPVEYNQSVFGSTPFTGKEDVERYFNSLPEYIQENIMQSGIEIESVSHLKELEQHYKDWLIFICKVFLCC